MPSLSTNVRGYLFLSEGNPCISHSYGSGNTIQVGKHGQQLLAPAGMDSAKVVDPAGRGWCEGYGPALAGCQADTGQWQPSSAGRVPMSSPSGLPGTWQSPQGSEQPVKVRDAGEQSIYEAPDRVVEVVDMERSAALDRIKLVGMGASGGGSPQSGGHMENAPQSPGKSGAETSTGINLSRGSSPLGFDGGPRGGPEVPAGDTGEGKSGGQHRPPRIRQLLPRPHGSSGAPPPFEPAFDPQAPLRVARPPGEGRGRNQLLPRYWPRITDQELKQITSGEYPSVDFVLILLHPVCVALKNIISLKLSQLLEAAMVISHVLVWHELLPSSVVVVLLA